ncbi:EcoRII N-terminal effector-binding domain-containing protein [Aeromonas rivipollensis]|uniref:EcoRII N-terminal effector-binding domain-containing protein n=1 Tax=Aeromonas rivipollensis TaxID=948519 RepID=UPI000FBC0718
MMEKTFSKTLSANDVGATGGHQAGILIPKTENDLLGILPPLDSQVKNPDAWLDCVDENDVVRRFRFIYYNNKLHDPKGTRNEYRITHMTGYFKEAVAREGDFFEISKIENENKYRIRIVRKKLEYAHSVIEDSSPKYENVIRIKIKSSWRRIH